MEAVEHEVRSEMEDQLVDKWYNVSCKTYSDVATAVDVPGS